MKPEYETSDCRKVDITSDCPLHHRTMVTLIFTGSGDEQNVRIDEQPSPAGKETDVDMMVWEIRTAL